MPRRDNPKDRGLVSRRWKTGKTMWYVRCAIGGRMKMFGPYDSKPLAKNMYYKLKTLDALGMPTPTATNKAYSRTLNQDNTTIELGACIYFLQGGPGGPIKIGFSTQLPTLLKAIHAINGEAVRFLGAVAGSKEDEARLHSQHATDRLHGEWFRLSHRLLLFLVNAGMRPTICTEATPDLVQTFMHEQPAISASLATQETLPAKMEQAQ